MAETQASSIFQEWAKRYAPGLYRVDTPTTFPTDSSALTPSTSVPDAPVVSPTEASPTAEATPSLIDRFGAGLSRVGERMGEGLKNPASMGLLGAGLSMMALPPRQVPYSNVEALGQGGLAGLKFYEQALEAKRKDEQMKLTAEEHKLSREDRRTAAEDRGQYYRDMAETRRMTAESQAEARKATAAENKVLDVPIDPAVAKHYGIDPKTTVRTFNKMQAGLTAMAKPEKSPDAFTRWWDKLVAETGKEPTSKQIETWHRNPGSGGGADSGPGKTGATSQVNSLVTSHYFADAKKNLESKGPAGMEELKGMTSLFATADPLGGGVHSARVRQALSPEKQKEFDFVTETAQEYSKTMVPAKAVAKAKRDWAEQNPAPKTKSMNDRYKEMMAVDAEIRSHGYSQEETTRRLKELHAYGRQQGLIQ